MSPQPPSFRPREFAENARRRQLAFIEAAVKTSGMHRTALAKAAGVSPSTISKFENDVDNIAQLEPGTIEKLAIASGVDFESFDRSLRMFSEQEAAEFEGALDPMVERAVAAMKGTENSVIPWVLATRNLELAGYLPGDVLLVDLNATPEEGDIVYAQVYDQFGHAQTLFRVYHKPYLVPAARSFKPFLVNDEHVVIRGVVVGSVRPRLSRLAS